VHITQDEDEGSLLLVMATLTRLKASSTLGSMMEASSPTAEIDLKEEKVYAHLDEEKERDVGTWVLDIEATNHMSRCWAVFMKLDTAVLSPMRFDDDSAACLQPPC
jgi:hypothetical protein